MPTNTMGREGAHPGRGSLGHSMGGFSGGKQGGSGAGGDRLGMLMQPRKAIGAPKAPIQQPMAQNIWSLLTQKFTPKFAAGTPLRRPGAI